MSPNREKRMTHTSSLKANGVMVLVAGALVLSLSMGIRQSFGLYLEPMTRDLAISHSSFSLAIALQNLLWGALTPLVASFADRWGTARTLALGGLAYAAGLLVMAWVPTLAGLQLGAGVLVGIAVSATGFPLVLSAIARHAPENRRGAWLGMATAGGSLGQFILLPTSQGLIGSFGWVSSLLVLSVAAAFIVPLAWPLQGRPVATGADSQPLGAALREAGRHRGYWLLNAGFFVCGFHVAFVATHLPAFLTSEGLSPTVGATALALVGFFNIIGSFAAGWLGTRLPMKRVLTGLYLARAILIILMLAAPLTPLTASLFGAGLGLLWLGTVPLTSGLVSQIFGARYLATLFGVVMLSHQVGAFLGAWLGGLSYDLTGSYTVVWWMAAGLALISAALHWPIADQPLRPAATPSPGQTTGAAAAD